MLRRSTWLTSQRMGYLLPTVVTILGLILICSNLTPASTHAAEQPILAEDQLGPSPDTDVAPVVDEPAPASGKRLNLLWLMFQGGWMMLPIYLMSILVVGLGIERFLGLRRDKVMPDPLVEELGSLSAAKDGFDPRQAYRVCQAHPSATANVVRSMLLKTGRPHAEVEHAVTEASDREANRLYANVRWLNMAAAVTPLLGLFGTVWGMINAFWDTTQLAAGQDKAVELASGIYVALVTTLGGLAVAIPAAILAHYYEGRIQKLFHQVEELLFNLMPQIEKYEGRLRINRQSLSEGGAVRTSGKEPIAPMKAT